MDLTVCICTYRRTQVLREALESLASCEPIDLAWELLVIDNAGDDAVRAIVESFAGRLPVIYRVEQKTGLSHARNHAIDIARAPVVLFTDDDVTFDPAWLRHMSSAIVAHDACDFFGGRIEAVWSIDRPAWFDTSRCPQFDDMLVHYHAGDTSGYWDRRTHKPFFGASLAVRVDAVKRAGGFDPGAGHSGGKLGAGEDSLMIDAIDRQGGRGWYVAEALLYHPVPEQRVTREFARAFAWRQGWVSAESHRRLEGGDTQRLPRWWYRVVIEQGCKAFCRWVAGLLRFDSAAAFAGEFAMRYNLSRFRHALRRREQCPG